MSKDSITINKEENGFVMRHGIDEGTTLYEGDCFDALRALEKVFEDVARRFLCWPVFETLASYKVTIKKIEKDKR